MSLRRKITFGIVLTIFGIATYIVYGVIYTWRHIPEAYAAWDTGQMLIKYMQVHQNRWPSSWEDLITVMNTESGSQTTLYGSRAGDTNYALSLRERERGQPIILGIDSCLSIGLYVGRPE